MDLLTSTYEIADSRLHIYPNPVSDIIYIDIEGQLNFEIKLYDLKGKLIMSKENLNQLEVFSFPSGMYLLDIRDLKTGQQVIEKVIIE